MQTNLFQNLETSYVQTITDIPTVLEMIKQGDYQMEILKARTYGKCHETYEAIKKRIPTFTPNGTFHRIRAQKNIQTLSGLIYLDIDHQVEPSIFYELPWIYSFWKSFGGINYGLLASVSGLTKDNFTSKWTYIEAFFKNINITLDVHSKDISRQCVISYDPDIYVNPNYTELVIPGSYKSFTTNSSTFPDTNTTDNYQYKLKYQTILPDYNDQDYIVIPEGKEYRNTYLPRNIYEGERHKWISSFTSTMLFNNPGITKDKLRQVVYRSNLDHCKPALTTEEINSLVNWSFKLHINHQLRIKTKRKKIWINPESKLNTREKRVIIGQQSKILQRKQTIQSLIVVYMTLKKQNQKVTQKQLHEQSNYSLSTVKKYWKEIIKEGTLC